MNRPYIIISSAMSCDGKLSTSSRKRIRLSNDDDIKAVDKLRSECDAILVGSTTLANDNPSLVLKFEEHKRERRQKNLPENPVKVAISKVCDIDCESKFFQLGDSKKYIFTTGLASKERIEKVKQYATVVQSKHAKVDIRQMVDYLYKNGIRKLLVEGGGSTSFSFLNAGVVDELRIAIAPIVLGGKASPTLVDGAGFDLGSFPAMDLLGVERLNDVVVLRYKISHDDDDNYFMGLAIEEAKKVKPSQEYYSVGAVIVKENQVISRGYTRKHGKVHAEECAINDAKEDVSGSTLYATMEPCSKRASSPHSCSELIIKHNISRVVFAIREPKGFVDCRGAEILTKHGIKADHLKKFEKDVEIFLNEAKKPLKQKEESK